VTLVIISCGNITGSARLRNVGTCLAEPGPHTLGVPHTYAKNYEVKVAYQ